MTERIKKAIDIFLDAINDGTLAKGTCTACAVGNLVAEGLGAKVKRMPIGEFEHFTCVDKNGNKVLNRKWSHCFCTADDGQAIIDRNDAEGLENIAATDFTFEELAAIEFAFEMNTRIYFTWYGLHTPQEIRADQIRGLAAVVKVMLEFDKQSASDADVREIFTDKAELIPITQ